MQQQTMIRWEKLKKKAPQEYIHNNQPMQQSLSICQKSNFTSHISSLSFELEKQSVMSAGTDPKANCDENVIVMEVDKSGNKGPEMINSTG
uniref:Uncharacterized protein n=1 Tax=Romanomermis culicivorax TaxID=13658 RepID=A0A915JJK5_ROMCU